MASPILLATVWHWFFGAILLVTSVFLILLVLVQRGRGGGLTGALGGMGGQSAFGTKAGDLFTRVTMGVAAFWLVMCVMSVKVLTSSAQGPFGSATRNSSSNVDREKDGGAGATDGDSKSDGDSKAGDSKAGDAKPGYSEPAEAADGTSGSSDAKPSDSSSKDSASSTPAPAGDAAKPEPESKP